MIRIGLAVLSAFAVLAVGCGDDESETGDDGASTELTVSAAASMTEAMEAYGESTDDVDEKFSFAGSDELAAQIRKGAPVDVFASANTSLPDDLNSEGLLEQPVTFIANELVVAVPADSDIDDISDLTAGDLDLVIGSEEVPVGSYTREVLDRLPADDSEAILESVRSEEPDVKGIVGKLVAGAGDAGFVYASDVEATDGELTAIELPQNLEPTVVYGAGVVEGTDNPEEAQAFVDSLLDGPAHQALLDAGFLEP